MPKKRLTNAQTRRHDEANSRSSQFCEGTLKCDSLSETAGLTNTPPNLCSLVIVLFNQRPLRASGDSLVIITTLHSAVMQVVEPLIQCFNGRKPCPSSNVYFKRKWYWNGIRWQSETEALYSAQYSSRSDGEVTSNITVYKRSHRQKSCKIT
jgi:hypothetical protein